MDLAISLLSGRKKYLLGNAYALCSGVTHDMLQVQIKKRILTI